MKIFSHVASRRNRRTIVAVFGVKKEIPVLERQLFSCGALKNVLQRKVTSMKRWTCSIIALCLIGYLTIPLTVIADERESNAPIYPPELVFDGMTYGDWAAAFWQWETAIPFSSNPAVTGTNCLIGQENGPVFFAPVSFGGSVTISCTIPAGKAIFITILTDECSTVEAVPFHGSNPQELRNCVGAGTDALDPNALVLTIDHRRVQNLSRFRVQTPPINFTMPTADNLFGLAAGASGTSMLDGYFVMLTPLPKGHHVLHFGGSFTSGPAAGFSADTTVNLTVQ